MKLLWAVFLGTVMVCISFPVSAGEMVHNNFSSILWYQNSAEHYAVACQVYRNAIVQLDPALKNKDWTAALEQTGDYQNLPPAVILDIDETVLDNSRLEGQFLKAGKDYDNKIWERWIKTASASAVPGSIEFIKTAQQKGIKVFFITNRACKARDNDENPCPQEGETLKNLELLGITGINTDNLLLKNEQAAWESEKAVRRSSLCENYRILMLLGDDLGDFIPDVKYGENSTIEKRRELADQYLEYWGRKWFILPNPMYGSWWKVSERENHPIRSFE